MRFSIFATLFLIVFAIVTVEARYRLKYPKGEFGEFGVDSIDEFDARVRRSNSIKVKRSAAFNPEEHDEQVISFLEQEAIRGEGIA